MTVFTKEITLPDKEYAPHPLMDKDDQKYYVHKDFIRAAMLLKDNKDYDFADIRLKSYRFMPPSVRFSLHPHEKWRREFVVDVIARASADPDKRFFSRRMTFTRGGDLFFDPGPIRQISVKETPKG